MRVVLDTNVYISAILFGGKCEEILKLAGQGLFKVIISKKILGEIKSVLKEKFYWTDKQIAEVIKYIKEIASIMNPEISLTIVNPAPRVETRGFLWYRYFDAPLHPRSARPASRSEAGEERGFMGCGVKEDHADNKIIECAVASNATYIVTGDKHHLLPIKEYAGIKIVSPIEFLRL